MSEDVVESRILTAPQNKVDFHSYDIYRNLTRHEKPEMQKKIEKDTVKFSASLDAEVLPMMPKNKNASLIAQRQFLGIIAERQARLQAQIDWINSEQEKYRKLRE